MRLQYQLKQIVIVTPKEQKASDSINNELEPLASDTSFLGVIVAINNGDLLCIRRFNPQPPLDTDTNQLQWININDGDYSITNVIL